MRATTLTLLSLALASTALAQGATVVTKEGTGEAAVLANDKQKAFDEARDRALRSAVEQAAGVRIDADSVAVNNQLVRDQVFSNTSGYVKKFEVKSKKEEKGVVTVVVTADVITENLDKDITAARDLVKRVGRPSIVIVVQEQTVPLEGKAIMNSDTMATVLTETFKADGWDIKDPQAMNKSLSLEGASTMGPTEIKKIGDLTKAAYVLYGKVSLRHQDPGAMLEKATVFLVSGEYDLALAATDTDSQIAKMAGKLVMQARKGELGLVSYERSSYDLIRARKDELVVPMRKAMLEHLRDQQVNGVEIAMTVSGLESYASVDQFKKSLEALKGIKEAQRGDFAAGKASFKVTFLGTSAQLAEAVEGSTFKKKKLSVTAVKNNAVEVAVAK